MALRTKIPEATLQRLAEQIANIAGKIDRAPSLPDAHALLSGVEHRLDLLSETLDRRQDAALEQENLFRRDFERRLDDIAGQLRHAPPVPDPEVLFSGLEKRFDALTQSLERRRSDALDQENPVLRDLERRLDQIAGQLRQAPALPDPEALFSGLEKRFDAFSVSLERHRNDALNLENPFLRDLGRRLDGIAGQLREKPPEPDPAAPRAPSFKDLLLRSLGK